MQIPTTAGENANDPPKSRRGEPPRPAPLSRGDDEGEVNDPSKNRHALGISALAIVAAGPEPRTECVGISTQVPAAAIAVGFIWEIRLPGPLRLAICSLDPSLRWSQLSTSRRRRCGRRSDCAHSPPAGRSSTWPLVRPPPPPSPCNPTHS